MIKSNMPKRKKKPIMTEESIEDDLTKEIPKQSISKVEELRENRVEDIMNKADNVVQTLQDGMVKEAEERKEKKRKQKKKKNTDGEGNNATVNESVNNNSTDNSLINTKNTDNTNANLSIQNDKSHSVKPILEKSINDVNTVNTTTGSVVKPKKHNKKNKEEDISNNNNNTNNETNNSTSIENNNANLSMQNNKSHSVQPILEKSISDVNTVNNTTGSVDKPKKQNKKKKAEDI
mmetsp:Transcript_12362/g.10449  ORF Transcript_12362/g.10449 Transcript_12362/m.10449 type:complete len:234 (-) Transcript_12362:1042-1743(-)